MYRKIGKNVSPDQLFPPVIIGMVRYTVKGAGGFEERRTGKRYNLALPVQLKNGTGITRDISTSGIFFETESAPSLGDAIRLFLNFEERLSSARRAWCGWRCLMVNSALPSEQPKTGLHRYTDLPLDAQFAISRALGKESSSYHAAAVEDGYLLDNRRHALKAISSKRCEVADRQRTLGAERLRLWY